MLNFTGAAHEFFDEETNVTTSLVRFKLEMQRKPLYYVMNLIVPTIIITEMTTLGMFTRSDGGGGRGSKVSIGLDGSIIAVSVFTYGQ